MTALDERLRPGAPAITAEAKVWIKALAYRKAKELGYPHELWTTRLLASHALEHGPAAGHQPALNPTSVPVTVAGVLVNLATG
jgi:hypothetical protein